MAIAAEAVARAKVEIAARGLNAVVVQNFYGMAVAQRHYNNARRSLQEAQQFVDITQKQEQGGEVAHSDVVKAQIQLEQRQRPCVGFAPHRIWWRGKGRANLRRLSDARALLRRYPGL